LLYAPVNGTLGSQALTLPALYSLPREVAKNLGLKGSIIPAGTYPVVFDAKSKVFNAMVSVK
jgi:hypothetical protein